MPAWLCMQASVYQQLEDHVTLLALCALRVHCKQCINDLILVLPVRNDIYSIFIYEFMFLPKMAPYASELHERSPIKLPRSECPIRDARGHSRSEEESSVVFGSL